MTCLPLLRSDQTLFHDPDVFEFTDRLSDHLHHQDARNSPGSSGAGARAPQPFNILNNHSIYYMLREFEKFVGFRVLAWFLTHPTGEIHINKLAREIGVSPGSVKSYADAFERDGLLTVTRLGTARLLSLDNDSFAVRELKRAGMVLLLVRAGIEELAPESTAVAIYGSTAAGTFDEQSDIDILILGDESRVDHGRVPALEAETGREVQLTIVPYYRWERMKEEGDPFVASVLQNHMLVTGARL
jgi:predicted nucleotidyltransferase